MDDEEFFDKLYQVWAQSGSDGWMIDDDGVIKSISTDGEFQEIAIAATPEIAHFITVAHGIIPELIEKAGAAFDESDRLDEEKDALIGQIMKLEAGR